jgi:hypothetical protein
MIWLGWAWAVVYAILAAISVALYAAFGDWPWGLLAFLPLVPYVLVVRALTRPGKRRGMLRAWLVALIVIMVLMLFRWQVIDALIGPG